MGRRVCIRVAEDEDITKVAGLNCALFREDAGRRDPLMDQDWPEKHGEDYFTANCKAIDPRDTPCAREQSSGTFGGSDMFPLCVRINYTENRCRSFLSRERSSCVVAEFAENVVGYLAGYVREGTTLRPVAVAELESMYVVGQYRNLGLGTQMVREFLEWAEAKGAEVVSVKAYADNEHAIRFYNKHGFQPRSTIMERAIR